MQLALRDYGADLQWNVGSLFCHEQVIYGLLQFFRYFNIPNPIKWVFGSIPSLMTGGRVPLIEIALKDALQTLAAHIEEGLACRLTLSNPHADAKMIREDSINAALMSFLNTHPVEGKRHGIIVTSDILAQHARDAYPNLEVILSIIRPAYDVGYGPGKDTLEWYSEKLTDPLYDVVVVNNAKLYEEGFLEALPCKDKVELLACHDCMRNCQMAKEHYERTVLFSQCLCKGYDTTQAHSLLQDTLRRCCANKQRHLDQTASYSIDEMKKVVAMGYRQFKLAGRVNSDDRFARDLHAYLFNHEVVRYLEMILPLQS